MRKQLLTIGNTYAILTYVVIGNIKGVQRMKTATKFTANELAVLKAMYDSMKANGFDFGIVEEVIPASGLPVATGRGTLREVRKKLTLSWDSDKVNGLTQFSPEEELDYGLSFEEWLERVKS
jgi:hypothetical protein